jgi:hypothetical protein
MCIQLSHDCFHLFFAIHTTITFPTPVSDCSLKDDNMGVTHSPEISAVDERDEALDGAQSRERLSWRKQAVIDLKPSWHRDT